LLPGVAGLARSAHAAAGGAKLRIHVLTPETDVQKARQLLRCVGAYQLETTDVQIHPVSKGWINQTLLPRIRVEADPAITGMLSSPLNYVRFFLPSLLPPNVVSSSSSAHILYLDADIIVQHSLHLLVEQVHLPPNVAVAAVPRHEVHFRYKRYERRCSSVYKVRYPHRPPLNPASETFNAGVMVINLHAWQQLNLTSEAIWWMEQHKADPNGGLWHLGSQPILHLMLHGQWHALPDHWNLDGLGRVARLPAAALSDAHLLHWTGRRKPWLPDGLHAHLFGRFVPRRLLPCIKL
jgi:lipopolysaccharide biosynthesis glycosyltransferase